MIEHRFITNFTKYRFLLVELVKKNLFVKYRGSALGILWSFLNPLCQVIVLTLVFGYLFSRSIPFFPIYLVIGRLLYSFFSSATKGSMNSIRRSSAIMKKIYIPKYIYALSSIFTETINLLITMVILIGLMIVLGCPFRIANLYSIVPTFLLIIFATGCGLILAPAYVYFKDVKYLYGVFTQLLMYGSAIFFPVTIVPVKYQFVFYLNPVFVAIDGFRGAILYGTIQPINQIIYLGVCALIALVAGIVIFYKTQDNFILKF